MSSKKQTICRAHHLRASARRRQKTPEDFLSPAAKIPKSPFSRFNLQLQFNVLLLRREHSSADSATRPAPAEVCGSRVSKPASARKSTIVQPSISSAGGPTPPASAPVDLRKPEQHLEAIMDNMMEVFNGIECKNFIVVGPVFVIFCP
ncbi:unnamed protein product [Cuscuta campestris]|uniref:Uncharacterized protein n=1 Tax=Cuscuta campestris TaxID=132261 RepID=A0A484NDG7_9ASTE|nr:unnamed protein product [Cuscuta campestris]